MPLCIREGSHRIARAAHQSWVKKLRRASVVRLVRVPPLSVLVMNEDIFHAGRPYTDGGTA